MSSSIVYATQTYVEPIPGSPEENDACRNIIATIGTFIGGVKCVCCQGLFGTLTGQYPPSLTLFCKCGDLVVLFDQTTTILDAFTAIDNRFVTVEQQEQDYVAPK